MCSSVLSCGAVFRTLAEHQNGGRSCSWNGANSSPAARLTRHAGAGMGYLGRRAPSQAAAVTNNARTVPATNATTVPIPYDMASSPESASK